MSELDVEVINKKDSQQLWSYIAGAHLITKDRRTFDPTFIDPPPPDGQIPAKFSVRGSIPFERPADAQLQYVRLQGNFTANGALVKLKPPKVPAQ